MRAKYVIPLCGLLSVALLWAVSPGMDMKMLAHTWRNYVGARGTVSSGGASAPAISFGLPYEIAVLSMKEPDARLLIPVRGVRVRQVADTWGGVRSGGREHKGQDIFAKRGTAVYSATEGYVLRVGESPVGGKTVFVLGAGGRRYYYAHLDAHAESLEVGDYVTTESLLGYVGASGNAKGTSPHLHFGVYTNAGAINPLPLLADRTVTT